MQSAQSTAAHAAPRCALVICHAVFRGMETVYGPAHSLRDALVELGWEVWFFELAYSDEGCRRCTILRPGAAPDVRMERALRGGPFKHGGDLLAVMRVMRAGGQLDLLVAVDPLTATFTRLAGCVCQRPQIRVFYGADYAEQRFAAAPMNALYHALDRAAVRWGDAVWGVSQPLADVRQLQGVPAERNFVMPNSPTYDPAQVRPSGTIARDRLVLISNLQESIDYGMVIDAMARLAAVAPTCRLEVIGDGEQRPHFERLCAAAGLSGRIHFHGHLPHAQAMAMIAECGAGLALYSADCPWHAYRDSVKIREYLALGVPVVTTAGHGLCDEISALGLGYVVADAAGLFTALDLWVRDASVWQVARAQALAYAQRYSKREWVAQVLTRLFSLPKSRA